MKTSAFIRAVVRLFLLLDNKSLLSYNDHKASMGPSPYLEDQLELHTLTLHHLNFS
jgi:hypothetical protein